MTEPTKDSAVALIEGAWKRRRESFDAAPAEKEIAFAEVTRDLSKAVSICRDLGDWATQSIALRRLGHAYLDVSKHEEARALMAQAVLAARESRDPCVIAHTIRHLGDVELDVERFEEAEKCYGEALSVYRAQEEPPTLDLANTLRPMAILKEKTGHDDEAKQLWAQARELYVKAGIGEGVKECAEHL